MLWKSGFGLLLQSTGILYHNLTQQWMYRETSEAQNKNESTFTSHKTPATPPSTGKNSKSERRAEGGVMQRGWKTDRDKRHIQYTCVHYNMRVMWSNHGKETARHRFRVLSSSPAYWPNGVALKTQTGEKNRVNNDREREEIEINWRDGEIWDQCWIIINTSSLYTHIKNIICRRSKTVLLHYLPESTHSKCTKTVEV